MQQIIIIGHVGQPATSQTYTGQVATNFTVAVNEKFTKEDGKKEERSIWYNCVIWKKGEPTKLAPFLIKGTKVFIQGKPSVRSYTDKNGTIRHALDIVVARVEFLSPKKEDENGEAKNAPVESTILPQSLPPSMVPDEEDNLPI